MVSSDTFHAAKYAGVSSEGESSAGSDSVASEARPSPAVNA